MRIDIIPKIITSLLICVAIVSSYPSNVRAESRDSLASGFDENCRSNVDDWRTVKKYPFSVRGKSYTLIYSAFVDGSGSLCLARPRSIKPIAAKYWSREFIDRLDRVSPKVFTFQVHQGNGTPSPTFKYRLDLNHPEQPQVRLIKKWVVK
jgi:hypothetical protein